MRAVPESQSEAIEETSQPSSALARDGAVAVPDPSDPRSLVTALLASARHELRSPLQSIQGFSELLESQSYGQLGREQLTFVEHILQSSIELSSVFEVCAELTEEELVARPLELSRMALARSLAEALTSAAASTRSTLAYDFDSIGDVRAKLELPTLKRAFGCLLTALAGGGTEHTFSAELTLDAELGCMRVLRAQATPDALMSVGELAKLRGMCRGLIWLRLADLLLAKQGALLLVGELVDQAEVRVRLSSTH